MHPEFFYAAHVATHAHAATSVVHSLPFGIGVAIVGGFLLSLLFGGSRRTS